jgi:cell division protein FtsW (lipid II flippase)
MNNRKKLEFIPQPHTDFIFQVVSKSRVPRFVASLIAPVGRTLVHLWYVLSHRWNSSDGGPPNEESS